MGINHEKGLIFCITNNHLSMSTCAQQRIFDRQIFGNFAIFAQNTKVDDKKNVLQLGTKQNLFQTPEIKANIGKIFAFE